MQNEYATLNQSNLTYPSLDCFCFGAVGGGASLENISSSFFLAAIKRCWKRRGAATL
jgi:hypothetical protein